MFDALSTRLQDVFQSLKGETRLTADTVEAALREIRLALLEADVNFKVVKAFIDRVRDRAMDQAVLKSLTPSQQVVKIVRDELLALFAVSAGTEVRDGEPTSVPAELPPAFPPSVPGPKPRVVLMLGLQGSGKTTTSAKLGHWLQKQGRYPLMVSTDVRRPAAIQQLAVMGEKASVRVHDPEGVMDPVARAKSAISAARNTGNDVVIVDTAGRLHIDDELMGELVAIKEAVRPSDLLYVADAMTGQDAIKSAGEFNRQVGVTGVVLTKIDGDARGGAALSVVSVVGVPIAFVGAGERFEDIEAFHADRFVSRLLGMGDVLSLIEKAEEAIDETEAEKLEEKIRKGGFSLDDFRDQLRTLRKMGPLEHILGMLPGMSQLTRGGPKGEPGQMAKPDERQLRRIEAMIGSMTPEERKHADVIDGSRRKRIARGSGTSVEDVNRLLKQFNEMQRMLKMVGNMTGQTIAAPPKKKKKKGPFSMMK
jgi:signal recognition particle subunit SRP54